MPTLRLTAAQALVRYLAAQRTVIDGAEVPLFAGVWAIFGHGNVAGLGEALYARPRARCRPIARTTSRRMAHAAIAFAKAKRRRRMMACTTSIGPGATNMVTAAAWRTSTGCRCCCCRAISSPAAGPIRCCSRSRISATATVTANDCFRPVSRYFDRIIRPEQLLTALPRALAC